MNAAITCKEVVELVTDYLEGALPPQEMARLQAHLAGCVDCTRYLAQMQQTIASVGKLSEEEITPQAIERLLGIFREWKAG